jgi:hypothetical protein
VARAGAPPPGPAGGGAGAAPPPDPWSSPDPNVVDAGMEVVVATSPNDAVVGGALAAGRHAAVLVADLTALTASPNARDWISARAGELVHAVVLGGAEGLRAEVDALVRSAGPHLAPAEIWPGGLLIFSDIAFSPHRGAIERIAEAGITSGCDPVGPRYCPGDPVLRGQMATFLANALGLDGIEDERFVDVPVGHTHHATINAVTEHGVAGGFADGTFRPALAVTRGQMATFLANALGLDPVAGARFSDVDDGHPHAGTVNAIADAGVAQGFPDGTFRPDAPVTRAQMATFLANALDLGLGEG